MNGLERKYHVKNPWDMWMYLCFIFAKCTGGSAAVACRSKHVQLEMEELRSAVGHNWWGFALACRPSATPWAARCSVTASLLLAPIN